MSDLDVPAQESQRAPTRRLPTRVRVALWVAISLVGILVSLQLMFLLIEVARPLIGPIPDDSMKERVMVAGGYAVWFGLSALISAIAWRRLLSR